MKTAFLRGSLLASAVVLACAMATPASAKARHAKAHQGMVPWHGWGDSFHYAGVRYPGGNRRGPKMSYNNWEGGFHPTAFLGDQGNRAYVKSPLSDQSNDDKPKRVFG